ncbi:MAG: EAL domain-containing protein, partial [Boseongicola sp.]|nr:EAL domain-containing protein [Boseongicola sp.]
MNWITHGYRPIAFIPYFLAATYWLAGGQTMTLVATIFPAAAVLLSLFTDRNAPPEHAPTGLRSLQSIDAWFQDHLQSGGATLAQTAVASLKIDNLENLEERLGIPMDDAILDEFANRVINTVRNGDVVVRGKKSDLLIFLTRVRAPESENLLHLSRRIQSCLDEPFHSGAARVYCTATIGIARANHVPDRSTSALIHAADVANRAAAKDGPGAVRIYKSSYGRTPNSDNALMGQVAAALENGQIIAWYQPQVSTHTGEISGFEALARWEHPTHGLISPASFLSMIDRLGLSQRLSEVILTHALSTLRAWDRAGLNIPSVSVNYSSDELSNPRLPEFLRWELDRFELAPDRLTVEVLENVIAESQEDIISRN